MFRRTVVEICCGAGGMSLGTVRAGFRPILLVDSDPDACATIRANQPHCLVLEEDLHDFFRQGRELPPFDLLAGGLPCPPFSEAGKRLGGNDPRDLFPVALRLIERYKPRAFMFENAPTLTYARFGDYVDRLFRRLTRAGYVPRISLLSAPWFGVPQRRKRAFIYGTRRDIFNPVEIVMSKALPPTVGQTVADLMAANGWRGAEEWSRNAHLPAPTIVGGSKRHGGPDLGPSRTRAAWKKLGVNGTSIANEAPAPDFEGHPRLTLRMVARLQSFPDRWQFHGSKTSIYRQIGNACPPPMAEAVAAAIDRALETGRHG